MRAAEPEGGAGHGDGVATAFAAFGGFGVELEAGGGAGELAAEGAGPGARIGGGEGFEDRLDLRGVIGAFLPSSFKPRTNPAKPAVNLFASAE
jgi:hypothetical protein